MDIGTGAQTNSKIESVPLTILTGFLGAGKTTLLKRILTGDHGLRVAVLVNDFGAINIDADLIVSVESDVVSLANGCVCCTVRDDLLDAIVQVIDRPERPQYVLLEASGVADPAGIAMTFAVPGLDDVIRLDGIICVVDAEQVFSAPEQMQLKLWQIGTSDLLILNKTDLVAQDQITKIKDWLSEHLHRYRLIQASHCQVPLDILLSTGLYDSENTVLNRGTQDTQVKPECGEHCHDHESHHHTHKTSFSSWTYESERPLSLEKLEAAASRLPASVYRCKGIILCEEFPDRRIILQVVGKRVNISHGRAWQNTKKETAPCSKIVVIGAAGALDPDILQKAFESCIATTQARSTSNVQS